MIIFPSKSLTRFGCKSKFGSRDERLIVRWYRAPFLIDRPRLWKRLMNWTPTNEELARLANLFSFAARLLDNALKLAVILAAIYFAIEILSAFLPGGVVSQLIGGAH